MTDDLRCQLIDALRAVQVDPIADEETTLREVADALLPLVETHGRASAATALRQAARDLYHGKAVIGLDTPDWLYDRADALEDLP